MFLEQKNMLKLYYSDGTEVTKMYMEYCDHSSCFSEPWCAAWGICEKENEQELLMSFWWCNLVTDIVNDLIASTSSYNSHGRDHSFYYILSPLSLLILVHQGSLRQHERSKCSVYSLVTSISFVVQFLHILLF